MLSELPDFMGITAVHSNTFPGLSATTFGIFTFGYCPLSRYFWINPLNLVA